MKVYKFKSRETGFTLIELLIVVIIIAVLAAVVVPQFGSSTDDASDSATAANLATLRGAIDLYYQQHGEYPSANTAAPEGACTDGTAGTGDKDTPEAFIEQLSLYTDEEGGACSTRSEGEYIYGPYLNRSELPVSITGYNDLEVVLDGNLNLTGAADGTDNKGWKFDNISGKLIIDHEEYDEL